MSDFQHDASYADRVAALAPRGGLRGEADAEVGYAGVDALHGELAGADPAPRVGQGRVDGGGEGLVALGDGGAVLDLDHVGLHPPGAGLRRGARHDVPRARARHREGAAGGQLGGGDVDVLPDARRGLAHHGRRPAAGGASSGDAEPASPSGDTASITARTVSTTSAGTTQVRQDRSDRRGRDRAAPAPRAAATRGARGPARGSGRGGLDGLGTGRRAPVTGGAASGGESAMASSPSAGAWPGGSHGHCPIRGDGPSRVTSAVAPRPAQAPAPRPVRRGVEQAEHGPGDGLRALDLGDVTDPAAAAGARRAASRRCARRDRRRRGGRARPTPPASAPRPARPRPTASAAAARTTCPAAPGTSGACASGAQPRRGALLGLRGGHGERARTDRLRVGVAERHRAGEAVAGAPRRPARRARGRRAAAAGPAPRAPADARGQGAQVGHGRADEGQRAHEVGARGGDQQRHRAAERVAEQVHGPGALPAQVVEVGDDDGGVRGGPVVARRRAGGVRPKPGRSTANPWQRPESAPASSVQLFDEPPSPWT